MMTNELLRRYVVDRSESAFAELVRQHIDLVYSAALRQVQGNAASAQDVTQAVFTDLARKAPRLTRHSSLTGWLYTSARYEAAKFCRSESRRRAREQQSHAMNQALQSNEPGTDAVWQDIRPALDDVMHQLSDSGREAILLRYFERKPLAEIAARFKVSDNAARMRIERALEKLRGELSKRGVTSTAAALALILAERAVSAAPANLAAQIGRSAVTAAGAGGLAAGVFNMFAPSNLAWLAGAAALIAIAIFAWPRANARFADSDSSSGPASVVSTVSSNASSAAPAPVAAAPDPSPAIDSTNKLSLHIVTADSGQPVPMVDFDYWVYEGPKFKHKEALHADRFGHLDVPVPRSTVTELLLVSERDGFADTRLLWHVDRGDVIPDSYTLRLDRAQHIGGQVVDEDNNPIAGASVGFNNDINDPALETKTQTTSFGWPFWIETKTDSTGHWQMDRVGADAVGTLSCSATDPNHVATNFRVAASSTAGKKLIAGQHVIRMANGVAVRGDVTDSSGHPIQNARVRVGYAAFTGTQSTLTKANGKFFVGGCKPENTPITADHVPGFAATTIEADLNSTHGPFHLVLKPGALLRLKVVDSRGQPIPRAYVFHNNLPAGGPIGADRGHLPNQADFESRTDADGVLNWTNAPDAVLKFDIVGANEARTSVSIRPDGAEHLVTLAPQWPGLTISGKVTDATTGQPIPVFRIITGWPETNFLTKETGAQWSTLDRFWLKFQNGAFHNHYNETPLGSDHNPGFIFKIEADGYAPFVTRPVSLDEDNVRLDAALQPAVKVTATVLLPNGQPAVQADVGLVSPSSGISLTPEGIDRRNIQSLESILATDTAGQFSFFPDPTIKKIVISHQSGFLETTVADLTNSSSVQLQPWSRVEGVLLCDGKPSPNRNVTLGFPKQSYQSLAADFETTTDADGHFVFPQAPPVAMQLNLKAPFSLPHAANAWTTVLLTNLDLLPSQTATLTAVTTVPAGSNFDPLHNHPPQ